MELILLFFSALFAATLFPAQSEAVLLALLYKGNHDTAVLIIVATCGNVLGAIINWGIGRYLEHFHDRKWFPLSKANLERGTALFQRYGSWTLLFSWLPFIGDPLTVIAGMLRMPLPTFVLLVTAGKLARYVAIVAMV